MWGGADRLRPGQWRLGMLSLLKALNDGVVAAAEISPDDLLITLYRGVAQRAHISDKERWRDESDAFQWVFFDTRAIKSPILERNSFRIGDVFVLL
jgi:hypothetical protein